MPLATPTSTDTIRRADWARNGDRNALQSIRSQVFVHEQQVPESLEWDGLDAEAVHVLAESSEGTPIGTARLLPSGKIGRMAVLREHRGRGVGTRLLLSLMKIAGQHGDAPVSLNAQSAVVDFYRRLGLETEGAEFDEAGIAHRRMVLRNPRRLLEQDLAHRRLGIDAGPLALEDATLVAGAAALLAAQAHRELCLLSADINPRLYDQAAFLSALRELALGRKGQPVLRVLLQDALAPVRRGHRLIELARTLSSAIELRILPEEATDAPNGMLLADDSGYCLEHKNGGAAVDFRSPSRVRELRHGFDQHWERSAPHTELRRLHL